MKAFHGFRSPSSELGGSGPCGLKGKNSYVGGLGFRGLGFKV